MTRNVFLFLIGIALFGAGCTMIPKYNRPEAPVPANWPSGPAYKQTPQKAQAAAELPWRQFFTDERLQSVIASALQNNRDLRVAALNVERARALYRIQRVELLPTINASGSASRQRQPAALTSSGSPKTSELYRADLGISYWEIDFFGRIRSLEKSALEQYLATEQARRSAQILLISEVANAYLALAADRENLQLAQSTLANQQAVYHLVKRRFDTGISSELDLRQAQTQVDAARVDVALYTQLAAQDKNALDLLVGSSVPADLLPKALSSVTPLPDVSPGTTSEALLSRPDILQAENLLKAANANIGAARAAFFPRIALTTSIGTASSDLSGLFDSGTGAWNYGAQIVMPIFDARTWPAFKASKVDKEIAVAQYEKAIQAAFREVADALAQRGTIGDQMDAQQSLVDATSISYRLADTRYTKGIDTYLNVLVAQRALYVSQQGLISTHISKLTNQVRLYEVLGGGGDPEARKD
ncbi:MAG: efflux transporter outer membrane subunit [Desulfobacterales bacterium]